MQTSRCHGMHAESAHGVKDTLVCAKLCTTGCGTRGSCGCAQYDEEPGHEAFADDFQQAMTYFTKLSLTGGEVLPTQQSHAHRGSGLGFGVDGQHQQVITYSSSSARTAARCPPMQRGLGCGRASACGHAVAAYMSPVHCLPGQFWLPLAPQGLSSGMGSTAWSPRPCRACM